MGAILEQPTKWGGYVEISKILKYLHDVMHSKILPKLVVTMMLLSALELGSKKVNFTELPSELTNQVILAGTNVGKKWKLTDLRHLMPASTKNGGMSNILREIDF